MAGKLRPSRASRDGDAQRVVDLQGINVLDVQHSARAIGFRLGHLKSDLPTYIDVLYRFEANEYNGRRTLQLNLKDVKPAGLPD